MNDGDVVAAWRDALDRLAALGDRVGTDAFPQDHGDRVDGVAHLVDQAVCWLAWAVFHADPRRPMFHRQNDLVTQWGGPNADNVYRHARVEPGRRYRIRGRMHACDELILAVRAGFMHQPTWGTLHEVSASSLGIGPGDDVDLVVGEGGDVPLPEGALTVSIREYYFDWQAEEPAVLTIECLDHDANAPNERLDGRDLMAQIDEGVSAVEHSIEYWNAYLRDHRAAQRANTFATGFRQAKGLDAARYAFCFWDLAPDEALVVDTDVPAARYWSFQLYALGWFEPIGLMERQTSLNHTQAAVDGDGRVRVVVAHEDPGVANWLDTGGRGGGLLMLRWFWPAGDDAPVPATSVVRVDQARAALPADTALVDPAGRAASLRRRRQHLAWRFRV